MGVGLSLGLPPWAHRERGHQPAVEAGLSRDKTLEAPWDNSEKTSRNAPPVLPTPQKRHTIRLRFQALICFVRENLQRVLPGRSLASLCRLRRWSSREATRSSPSFSPLEALGGPPGGTTHPRQQSRSFLRRALIFPCTAELLSLYSVRLQPSPPQSTLRIRKQNKKKTTLSLLNFVPLPTPLHPQKGRQYSQKARPPDSLRNGCTAHGTSEQVPPQR